MKDYPQNMLRNVCIAGHGSDGKTSLTEAILFASKAIDRPGNIASGTTVSDFDAEEVKRGISLSTAIAPVEWKGCKNNLLDTPGFFDFVGETLQGLAAAETALIVLSGRSGVEVGTEKVFGYAKDKPKAFVISRLDEETADYFKALDSLTDAFGVGVCPLTVPIVSGGKLAGYYSFLSESAVDLDGKAMAAPAEMADTLEELKDKLFENIAETDEALMDKYFAGEAFTEQERQTGLAAGVAAGSLFPVFAASAMDKGGVSLLLDAVAAVFPNPGYIKSVPAKDMKGEDIEISTSESDPFCASVFKTVADPFVGKMSFFKIISGTLGGDKSIVNTVTGQSEKLSRIYIPFGKKQIDTAKLAAGDIGIVTKLTNTNTGDTLCETARQVVLPRIELPKPCLSMAVVPKAKGDEEKITGGLQRLMEEDLTFRYSVNPETHQQIVSGMGDSHLDVIVSKLKNKFGVSVDLKTPKVPYRETIKKKVKVEGKHKKQSGGHGQYGHVWIEFEPGTESDLVFEENVFGGSVPKNFFPAVEKGLRDAIQKGVLAGYPVVNLKATLVDGSYHPVDSSEMSFKVAASLAYKNGLPQAQPVLLEPIGTLKTYIPESMMGDIIGDINKRRGRVLGMNSVGGGQQEVVCEVPMAEMHTYATDLRSMTRGRGSFEFAFERYQEVPANIAQKVMDEAAAEADDAE